MSNIYEGMKPSEVVKSFIDWLTEKKAEQEEAYKTFIAEDGDKVKDFLHELEFEVNNKRRAVIATKIHNSRKKRRIAKDVSTLLKPVKEFTSDATNRGFVKRLKKLQADLKSQEDFLESDRVYKPRAQQEEGKDGHDDERRNEKTDR